MPGDRDGVMVTGVGARSAVGDHALQVAASVRAAVSGARAWPHAEEIVAAFVDPDLRDRPWTEKAVSLLGDPAAEALAGAGWLGRGAVAEAARSGRLRAFAGVPHPERPCRGDAALASVARTLSEELLPGDGPLPVEVFGLDHAAGVAAIARACSALQEGAAELALVLGVDSLLDSATLAPLLLAERLRIPDGRGGLCPGEAGACLVLETASAARRRGATPLARVDAVALEREAESGPDAPVAARALGRALRGATRAAGGAAGFTAIYADLNGERWRFLEWALAETRLSAGLPHAWRLWHPADALGDVGAAFAPLAVTLAVRAFARGYAGGGKALVVASSERGERGVVALGAP